MGKKDKNKKKVKGAEKTSAKTEKKLINKHKKELKAIGEVYQKGTFPKTVRFYTIFLQDDIENIIAQIEKEEQTRQRVTEIVVDPPSRRLNFTFVAHPEKEELILFGGEYFNGQKVKTIS